MPRNILDRVHNLFVLAEVPNVHEAAVAAARAQALIQAHRLDLLVPADPLPVAGRKEIVDDQLAVTHDVPGRRQTRAHAGVVDGLGAGR